MSPIERLDDPSEPLDVLIIGAGPIGLACALEAQKRGFRYVTIEKGCVANSIYGYPLFMHFASTPDLLELGGVPFIAQTEKPTRQEALAYYRRVADHHNLRIHLYEKVLSVQGEDGAFEVTTDKERYRTAKVIAAVGYFDHPQPTDIPGADLPKVDRYYKEPHPYSAQDLLVIGSGNSAAEAALQAYRHGARVTLVLRAKDFHQGIKYWIRPDIENRIKNKEITACFETEVLSIEEDRCVLRTAGGEPFSIPNDFVLILTGYEPDFDFLERCGIEIGDLPHRTPAHDPETFETNCKGIFLAGVVAGGLNTNKWFIENSRAHAKAIFDSLG